MGLQTDQASFYSNGAVSLTNAFTGFNELTVSNGTPLIDLKSIYGISNIRDKVTATGSGAVTAERGLFKLSTGTTADSSVRLDSTEYGRYVAGFEAVPGVGVMLSRMPTGNEVARWGNYNTDDGFGFGADANGFFTFLRSGGVERVHRQEDWRRANFEFPWDALVIYRMPFRWYGSGPVNFEIAYTDRIGVAKLKKVDTFESEAGKPLTEDPNTPLAVEVSNGGDSTDLELFVGGRQFFIQGAYNPNRRITTEHNFDVAVSTTFVPIVSWLQKETFASVSVKLEGLVTLAGGSDILYELRIGPALTGASFVAPTNVPASETAIEFDTSATAITGGQKIFAGLVSAGGGNTSGGERVAVPDIDIPKDQIVTLCARAISGNATVSSILKAREEW